jgi:RecB family exonuclease
MRRLLKALFSALLISLVCVTSTPAQADKESQRVEKVKHQVNKIGVDENVEVRLTNSTKLKGRIGSIGADYFVVVDRKTGDATTLNFAQVKQIRTALDNPFSDPAVLMGLACIPAIIFLSVLAKRAD